MGQTLVDSDVDSKRHKLIEGLNELEKIDLMIKLFFLLNLGLLWLILKRIIKMKKISL